MWCIESLNFKLDRQLVAIYWGVPNTCPKSKLVSHPKQSMCPHPNIPLPYFSKPQIIQCSVHPRSCRIPKICHSTASPYCSIGSIVTSVSWWCGHSVLFYLVSLFCPIIHLLWQARRLQIWLLNLKIKQHKCRTALRPFQKASWRYLSSSEWLQVRKFSRQEPESRCELFIARRLEKWKTQFLDF